MSHSGFQYSHPELTFDFSNEKNEKSIWSVFQRMIAFVLLIALIPLFAVLFVVVRSTSPGPFIFRQRRVGLYGTIFDVFKIRTMRRGSEKVSLFGVNNTSFHVTKIGRLLRATKVDEFPQLWNVAKGEMNLVGPRPIPLPLNDKLSEEIPGFSTRYDVKPGLTSIGQICIHDNQLDEKLVSDWKVRFEGERHYIRNQCFRYDLLMISMTVLYVVRKLFCLKSSQKKVCK